MQQRQGRARNITSRLGRGEAVRSINRWLADLGLDQYAALFELNNVDVSVLPTLTESDLQGLGVSLGHRKRMLLALQRENSDLRASLCEVPKLAAFESLAAEGERRHVTVLFCDLVGSTAL